MKAPNTFGSKKLLMLIILLALAFILGACGSEPEVSFVTYEIPEDNPMYVALVNNENNQTWLPESWYEAGWEFDPNGNPATIYTVNQDCTFVALQGTVTNMVAKCAGTVTIPVAGDYETFSFSAFQINEDGTMKILNQR